MGKDNVIFDWPDMQLSYGFNGTNYYLCMLWKKKGYKGMNTIAYAPFNVHSFAPDKLYLSKYFSKSYFKPEYWEDIVKLFNPTFNSCGGFFVFDNVLNLKGINII